MIKIIINVFLWTLGFIVLCVLFSSILIIFGCIQIDEKLSGKAFTALSSIAISAGVLLAMLTYSREKRKTEVELERAISKYFLEEVDKGFSEVVELLKEHTNDNILWVRAARSLLKTLELKEQVKSSECIIAYNLMEERVRSELYRMLSTSNENVGESLPPQFFYGIKDWKGSTISLDEAAIKASSNSSGYTADINSIPPEAEMALTAISEESVIAIFDFIESPDNYKDPLEHIKIWSDRWEDSIDISQGAKRYIAHMKVTTIIGGQIQKEL